MVTYVFFAVTAIEYVGFRLSTEVISPLQSNVEAILSVPEPTSAVQLASFLDMMSYYMKFMPQYSAITASLRQLLRRDEPWVWSLECTKAVQTLEAQITSPPVLTHFDISSHTLVTCDASALAMGAVLSQVQNGVERPVAFASRALNQTEQSYSVGVSEIIHMLHSPLEDGQENYQELLAFSWVKQELSCWNETSVARGFCTVIPRALRTRVLAMAHEGHLGMVKLKQRCCDLVWWPGIDKEIETLVKECPACVVIVDFLESLFPLGPSTDHYH
ncbi:hypothetical protein F2P79_015758 [Pimephales promelas]|nr:hypothetical protein F2P79_015758 [Pimephales promelas]